MSSSEDEDIPPLEDFTELVEKTKKIDIKPIPVLKTEFLEGSADRSNVANIIKTPKLDKEIKLKPVQQTKPTAASASGASYGGFKKGFLFSSNHEKPTKKQPVTVVKATKQDEKRLEIPEVQEAMKAGEMFAKDTSWINDDLLTNIQKNETLTQRLADPQFMQALQEFQTNPAAASDKYKDNPEVQKFFKEFCGLMGQHFSGLGDQNPPASPGSTPDVFARDPSQQADIKPVSPNAPSAAEEARMQDILANPEIREILQDPRIQKLIETLRTDPEKAQRVLSTSDGDFRDKIQKLCQVGLLQFQR